MTGLENVRKFILDELSTIIDQGEARAKERHRFHTCEGNLFEASMYQAWMYYFRDLEWINEQVLESDLEELKVAMEEEISALTSCIDAIDKKSPQGLSIDHLGSLRAILNTDRTALIAIREELSK